MMVLTAKVDFKKIMLILASVAALLLCLILLMGGDRETAAQTAALAAGSNDSRVQFLEGFGWKVKASPKESSQVRIPEKSSEVFDRYNLLQKGQGYDLSEYAGKKVMRYVYEVENYPGAKEPVYATVLVYKNKIIGGDVTDTSVRGKIRGFKMPSPAETIPPASEETTAPTLGESAPETTQPAAPAVP